MAEPVDVIADLVEALPSDRTRWVAVDGGGASGKTTFAERLAVRLGAVVVHGDDFAARGLPTWDHDRFLRQVVRPLAAGHSSVYEVWGWGASSPGGNVSIPAGGIVVVEGVSVTDSRVDVPWDVIVWLDVARDVRLARALARDGEAMRSVWEDDWLPSEDAWMARDRPWERADIIVDAS